MSAADPDGSERPKDHSTRRFRSLGRAADAGSTLSGSVIGCLLVGYGLGVYFEANPGATIGGLIVGLVVGFYNLAKAMKLFG